MGALMWEGFLWLSERFGWFPFNKYVGCTVLVTVASVAVIFLLLLAWFPVSLLFGRRFQFSLRSLLVFTTVVAVACSWLAAEMKRAREQAAAVKAIRRFGTGCWYDWGVESADKREPVRYHLREYLCFMPDSDSPVPEWLHKLFGDDFFAMVSRVDIDFTSPEFPWEHLERLAELRILNFRHTKTIDAQLQHLAGLTHLRELNLFCERITGEGLQHLAGMTQLRGLSLNTTEITNQGLEHLKPLASLRSLGLMDTKITDAGLEHLGSLQQLELLALDRTQITDAGLRHLRGLTRLRLLSLSGTKVTDAGLEYLTGLVDLDIDLIDVRDTPFTKQGLSKLREALQKCRNER